MIKLSSCKLFDKKIDMTPIMLFFFSPEKPFRDEFSHCYSEEISFFEDSGEYRKSIFDPLIFILSFSYVVLEMT